MPYDAFGNFTRDYNFTNDKLAGIKIQSVRVDGECDNYATGFNQVILRNGVAPMEGNLKLGGNDINGISAASAGTPGLSFVGDVTTGFYLPSPGELGFSAVGEEVMRITSGGVQVTGLLGFIGDTTTGFFQPSSDIIGVKVLTNEVARFLDSGIQITGTAGVGAGVAFPAVQIPSTDPNILDDYEEGIWTPTLVGDTGATGQVYGNTGGEYIKIGRKVFVTGQITLTTKGTLTGTFAVIGGLPFPLDLINAGSAPLESAGQLIVGGGLTAHYSASIYSTYNGAIYVYINLKKAIGNTVTLALLADVSNGAVLVFSFDYLAAA